MAGSRGGAPPGDRLLERPRAYSNADGSAGRTHGYGGAGHPHAYASAGHPHACASADGRADRHARSRYSNA